MTQFFAILSIVGFGRLLLSPWSKKLSLLEILGLSYLLGLFILTILLFVSNFLGFTLNMGLAHILTLVGSLLTLVFSWIDRSRLTRVAITPTAKPYFIAVITIMAIVTLYGLWGVVTTWDALTLYDFRAQRLVELGNLSQVAKIQGNYFYSYPLFTTLAHTYLYLTGWASPLIVYAGIYLSLLTIFYSRLKAQKISDTLSLIATLCVAIAPHYFWHSQIAYTNLPYTTYLALGLLYLHSYLGSQNKSELYLGVILSAASTWVRSVEPFWLINLLFALILILRSRHYRSFIPSLLITLGVERIWKTYTGIMQSRVVESSFSQISSNVATLTTSIKPDNSVLILSAINYFITHAMRPYLPVLILLVVTLLVKIISRSSSYWLESVIFAYYGVAFAGTLIFATTQSYWSNIPGSLERMMMFISVPIIFNFILIVKKVS